MPKIKIEEKLTLEERKELRQLLPIGYMIEITNDTELSVRTVENWFSGHSDNSRIMEVVVRLAKKEQKRLSRIKLDAKRIINK